LATITVRHLLPISWLAKPDEIAMGSLAVLRLDQLQLAAGRSLLRVAANAYLTGHYTSVSRQ